MFIQPLSAIGIIVWAPAEVCFWHVCDLVNCSRYRTLYVIRVSRQMSANECNLQSRDQLPRRGLTTFKYQPAPQSPTHRPLLFRGNAPYFQVLNVREAIEQPSGF